MNLKKLLCVLLALVMVLSLAACSESDNRRDKDDDEDEEEEEKVVELEDGIVGSWTLKIDMTEELTGVDGFSIDDLPMCLTFEDDGTATLTFDDNAIEMMEDATAQMMEDMLYEQLASEGTKDEIDEMFEEYYGMSIQDYIDEYMAEADVASELSDIEESFEYEVDGDTLIMDGTEMTAEITGNTLTITDCEDEDFWGEVGLELPLEMKRAD